MKIKIVLSAIALASTSFSQNVVPDIKGFALGMTMEQCLIRHKGESSYKEELAARFNGDSYYWGSVSEINPLRCFLKFSRFSPAEGRSKGGDDIAGNFPNGEQITFAGSMVEIQALFKTNFPKSNSTLYYLCVDFSKDNFEVVFEGLVKKYGTPTKTENVEKVNGLGRKFSGVNASWTLASGKYEITLESLGDTTEKSKLTMMDMLILSQISEGDTNHRKNLSKDI